VLVKLIDDHGPEAIIGAAKRLSDERYADLVISTAHKAKGREWDSVRIADDFRQPKKNPDKPDELPAISPAEAMLAYVAVTRTKLVLDRSGLAWIDDYVNTGNRQSPASTRRQTPEPGDCRLPHL
jgi:superfamily I DNA/RNA helicase